MEFEEKTFDVCDLYYLKNNIIYTPPKWTKVPVRYIIRRQEFDFEHYAM